MSSFGSPLHEIVFTKDKSATFVKGSNSKFFESSVPIWKQHLPRNNIKLYYTSDWFRRDTALEEDKISLINISESGSESSEFNQEPNVKEKNQIDDQTLETLWKLYRNVGESVEDVKKRLIDPSKNILNIQIELQNEKLDSLSSKSPGNNKNIISLNYKDENNENVNNIIEAECEEINHSWKRNVYCKDSFIFDKILKVEIQESNESIPMLTNCNDLLESTANYSQSFEVPRLKQITKAELIVNKMFLNENRTRNENVKCIVQRKGTRGPKRNKRLTKSRKRNSQTINRSYNDQAHINFPKPLNITRLSDNTSDEEIDVINNSSDENNINMNKSKGAPVILSSSLRKQAKRKLNDDEFFNSFTVNLSSDSDNNEEYFVKNENVKKQKLYITKNVDFAK